jgi:integrase
VIVLTLVLASARSSLALAVYTLEEIKQFLKVFPAGAVAVAIRINALLALRKPEVEALLPDDYDKQGGRIRIHRDTKTGNDECLPVVAPLAKLLADGWEQINLRRAEYDIRKRIKGHQPSVEGLVCVSPWPSNQSVPLRDAARTGLPNPT